jgi:hypothetical protein
VNHGGVKIISGFGTYVDLKNIDRRNANAFNDGFCPLTSIESTLIFTPKRSVVGLGFLPLVRSTGSP